MRRALRWWLQFGRREQLDLYERKRARGEPTPLDSIALPPEGLEWIERAWHELSQSRHSQETGIPISEIRAWLDERGIDEYDERRSVRELVMAMDAEFQSWAAQERKIRDRHAMDNAKRRERLKKR